MKVLHLPTNVASQISVTVRALRDIGVDARGLVLKNAATQDGRCIECYSKFSRRKYPIRGTIQRLKWRRAVLKAIHWADVVHWHCGSPTLRKDHDLRYVAMLDKTRIAEFWGSEIRVPEIASADNPYIARMYQSHPELARGKHKRSLNAQRRFARYGFECLVPDSEMASYIQKDIWSSPYKSRQRLITSEFETKYPNIGNSRPLLVHTPSNKAKKGTEVILKAIDQLKSKYEFDFQLIHGVEHSKAFEIMRNADIMIDEVVHGAYGLAALEAMAFGKPTLCYIKPSLVSQYPDDLPIINANQENLTEVLAGLLENGQMRHEIGRRSRAYVEKHHDAHKIAKELVAIYEELISKRKRKKPVVKS